MKIIRRTVDPITFVERVGIGFIPRIEDFVFDDQLAGSMSYEAPPRNALRTVAAPPPPPQLTSDEGRPPTPPKQRTDSNPNSPRNPSRILSPGGGLMSPRRNSKRKSLQRMLSLSQIGEDHELMDGSLSNLSALQTSISKIDSAEEAKGVKSVRFSDENELNEVSRMRNSVIAEIFWASDDLANFRYEAFMEEAGLDIEDFD
jgi:hypothetical protein